jgi:TetR/AcrR family transcriptional repressor of nem operon
MNSRDTRDALISTGLREMLRGGYDSVGIAGVLATTGVPKGSFYHYFDSKEAFGCAIIEAYSEQWRARRQAMFRRSDLPPLDRLRAHFRDLEADVTAQNGLGGCLLGNISQLMASRSEPLRRAVAKAFREWQDDVMQVLEAARSAGDLRLDADASEIAALVIEAYEGALLCAKAQGSLAPLGRFRCKTLERLLAQ